MRPRLHDRRAGNAPRPAASWSEALPRLVAAAGCEAWPLDIVLVDETEIAVLNRDWRRHDEVTDVLSFSYLEEDGPGRPDLVAGERYAARNLWRGPGDDEADAPAGELILAPAFVAARCAEQGWAEEAELALLTVHGLLHVLGWAHGDATAAAAMRLRESQLLQASGFAHPLAAMKEAGREEPGKEGEDGPRHG